MNQNRPLAVRLHPGVTPHLPEVTYVLRTLLRSAGFATDIACADVADDGPRPDLYYGPFDGESRGRVHIVADDLPFEHARRMTPVELAGEERLPLLRFGASPAAIERTGDDLIVHSDLVFACYWMLTGAGEVEARLDRWDNLVLGGSFLVESGLLRRPIVSLWAAFLRDHYRACGIRPEPLPWTAGGKEAAFAFTHDVDYPQILRTVESLRVLARGGDRRRRLAEVWRGQPFWKFGEWVDLAARFGTRPAFYFMARRGSLVRYALGTPDAFYDIRRPEFARLFRELRGADCEIGLHASFHAHRDARRLADEKAALEEASGGVVTGNRHHYWHLDPAAPHETLRRHEQAGLVYDSSLGLEFHPGFRRGICHPFHPWHPGERRELQLLELPPTWMDDHFDRRLAHNAIEDPEAAAAELLAASRSTGGLAIVDYHVRGMNETFFPRYGRWFAEFAERHLDEAWTFRTPAELARDYAVYEATLDERSAVHPGGRPEVRVAPVAASPAGESFVLPLDESREADWEAFVRGHASASPYHLLSWRDVTREGLGHEPLHLYAARPDGSLAGVLPLFEVDGIFGRRLVSVPMRDRGGVLTVDAEAAARLVDAAIDLTRARAARYLEIKSLDPLPGDFVRERGLIPVVAWVTTRVDLSAGSEALWKALDRKVRAPIRNAGKNGIRVEMDDSSAAVEQFYRLFARTRGAMGIPPFPRRLFDAIRRFMMQTDQANLFLVYKGDTPINGLINVYLNDTVLPAYAAPQREWRNVSPSEIAFWHAMEWAAGRGFRTWDFGADSPRQRSLLWYKRKWGGVHRPVWFYYYLNGPDAPPSFDSSSPGYGLARRLWSGLPSPVSRVAGAWVTRQLS